MRSVVLFLAVFSHGSRALLPQNAFGLYSKYQGFHTVEYSQLNCIDTKVTRQNPEDKEFRDNDDSWKTTVDPNIVPIWRESFSVRPELITFDAFNTLIEPSQSIGRWYREALNIVCDMQIRLPRPALFSAAFKKAYSDMCELHPCFGAQSGMTVESWWLAVVRQTYRTTENLNQIEPDELEMLMPKIFHMLYHDIFSTKTGWVVKEDVEYTLSKMKAWRDQGSGPRLGVISNFDNRLSNILADVGLRHYFDFVLTSHDVKASKPDRALFEEAQRRVKASAPSTCYHIGDSVETDVNGAVDAGWTAMRINEKFDDDFPDWFQVDTAETITATSERRQEMMHWGRKNLLTGREWVEIWGLDDALQLFGFPEDPDKPIATTYLRGLED